VHPGGAPAKKDERSLLTILLQECLKDRNVWLFAITYFFVYVVRQARHGLQSVAGPTTMLTPKQRRCRP
jgi:hypothetical protein